jgi:hypothetical protein
VLRSHYWEQSIVVGDAGNGNVYVARPTLIPREGRTSDSLVPRLVHGIANSRLFNRNPNYLTDDATRRLARDDVPFDVGLQFYRNEKDTPLYNDGDKRWKGPVVKVATVTLPRQKLSKGRREEIDRTGSAGPQVVARTVRVPAEGVSEFQAARRIAYDQSTRNRGVPSQP